MMHVAVSMIALALWLPCATVFAEGLDARLQWAQRVALGTPVSGVIERVDAVPGQRVKRGQVLLALDARPLQARVTGLDAELVGRQHDLDEARRELERTQELYERTLLADHDLALAKIALAGAEATLKTTEARLTQARWELEYSRIRAPFAAWVLQRQAEPGQTVVSTLQAEPLLVVARAGVMLARAMIDADRLSSLKPGQKVDVKVAGRTHAGRVQAIGLEPDGDGKYPLDVQFDSGERLLRAGLPARIELP